MDHWEGLSTVFNHWNFCFKIIIHYQATVDFVTQDGPFFHETFKIFVVINQKLCGVWGQKLVWVVNTIGTTNTPSFIKIQEVTQNSLLIWHGMTHMISLRFVNFVDPSRVKDVSVDLQVYMVHPGPLWHCSSSVAFQQVPQD